MLEIIIFCIFIFIGYIILRKGRRYEDYVYQYDVEIKKGKKSC